jgi:hypothetical protein
MTIERTRENPGRDRDPRDGPDMLLRPSRPAHRHAPAPTVREAARAPRPPVGVGCGEGAGRTACRVSGIGRPDDGWGTAVIVARRRSFSPVGGAPTALRFARSSLLATLVATVVVWALVPMYAA